MVLGVFKKVIASPEIQRSSHVLNGVGGKVYLFGGEILPRQPVPADVHVVDIESGTLHKISFSQLSGDAATPQARVGTSGAVLNGKIYMFSGRGGAEMAPIDERGGLWEYDPTGECWSLIEPADPSQARPENRSYHATTSDGTSTVFIHAGCPEKGRLADLWAFDLLARSWKQLQSAPDPPRGGTSIAYLDGKLYRMHGFDGESEVGGAIDIYDLDEGKWTSRAFEPDGWPGPWPRSVGSLLPLVIEGRQTLVSMYGEREPSGLGHQGAGRMSSDIKWYDVKQGQWNGMTIIGDWMPSGRGWFAADVVKLDGEDAIVMHGGLNEDNERCDDMFVLHFDQFREWKY